MVQATCQTSPRFVRSLVALLAVSLFVGAARGADGQAPRSAANATLRRAYELSRAAASEAEFARVLALCDEAAAQGLRLPAAARYETKLRLWTLEARATLRMDESRLAEAIGDFDAALSLDPKRIPALRLRGVCLAKLGRHDEAFVDLDRAIDLGRGDAQSYARRGEVNYATGRYQESLHDYEQALRLKPGEAAALVGRGHAKYRLGRIAAAVKDYSAAIELRPRDAVLYTQRGNAYADTGRYTEAAADFRRAMKLDPGCGRAYQSAAWLMSNCPDPRYRDAELAIHLAKQAIDLDGKSNHRYLETLAAALANAGYFEEAREVQERALQRAPEKALSGGRRKRDLFAAGRPFRQAAKTE